VPRNIAVFALPLSQSVRLLTALVHDPDLPYRVRQGAATILLPHLRAERDRLLQERILAQQAQDLAPPVRIQIAELRTFKLRAVGRLRDARRLLESLEEETVP
jgi:hypothetical protein